MLRTWGQVQYLLKEHAAHLSRSAHIGLAAVLSSEIFRAAHYDLLYACTFASVALFFQGTHDVDAGCFLRFWCC